MIDDGQRAVLERIATALEAMVPPQPLPTDFTTADGFVWNPEPAGKAPEPLFRAVRQIQHMPFALLQAVDQQAATLLDNTRRFAEGLPANNALLWGARGMGKSSLVKAAHAQVNDDLADGISGARLKLVEIHREDIDSLPACLNELRTADYHFIVFCDDLSFEADETSYKSLKAVLDGGIEGRPENVIFYATSNRRHLIEREMTENARGSAINPGDAVQEKTSLSDRFGLWLGFHNCSQDDYLAMVAGYAEHFAIPVPADALRAEAIAWSATRGNRSGRTAWQFIQDAAGRHGVELS